MVSWRTGAAAPFFDVLHAATQLHLEAQLGSQEDAGRALAELRVLCAVGGAADRAVAELLDEDQDDDEDGPGCVARA